APAAMPPPPPPPAAMSNSLVERSTTKEPPPPPPPAYSLPPLYVAPLLPRAPTTISSTSPLCTSNSPDTYAPSPPRLPAPAPSPPWAPQAWMRMCSTHAGMVNVATPSVGPRLPLAPPVTGPSGQGSQASPRPSSSRSVCSSLGSFGQLSRSSGMPSSSASPSSSGPVDPPWLVSSASSTPVEEESPTLVVVVVLADVPSSRGVVSSSSVPVVLVLVVPSVVVLSPVVVVPSVLVVPPVVVVSRVVVDALPVTSVDSTSGVKQLAANVARIAPRAKKRGSHRYVIPPRMKAFGRADNHVDLRQGKLRSCPSLRAVRKTLENGVRTALVFASYRSNRMMREPAWPRAGIETKKAGGGRLAYVCAFDAPDRPGVALRPRISRRCRCQYWCRCRYRRCPSPRRRPRATACRSHRPRRTTRPGEADTSRRCRTTVDPRRHPRCRSLPCCRLPWSRAGPRRRSSSSRAILRG